jgi:glucose-1-phosphate adenylyltransferase
VEESILFDFCEVGSGCRIKRSIIDRFNLIKPGEEIGYDLERDKQRFTVNNKGVVTIPRAPTRFFY